MWVLIAVLVDGAVSDDFNGKWKAHESNCAIFSFLLDVNVNENKAFMVLIHENEVLIFYSLSGFCSCSCFFFIVDLEGPDCLTSLQVSLMNQFQLHQLLNSGLSGNQVLAAALNNQLLATAAAQSGLQLAAAQSGMLNQSVIRRVGKASASLSDHPQKVVISMVKSEESDEDGEESIISENGGEEKDDERDRLDRGPTIAQLTNTPGVIRSTKGISQHISCCLELSIFET